MWIIKTYRFIKQKNHFVVWTELTFYDEPSYLNFPLLWHFCQNSKDIKLIKIVWQIFDHAKLFIKKLAAFYSFHFLMVQNNPTPRISEYIACFPIAPRIYRHFTRISARDLYCIANIHRQPAGPIKWTLQPPVTLKYWGFNTQYCNTLSCFD